MTFTHALATNNYGPAKFIVDASAANGTHTTIASALTSASSGDTIFIRPGTYTENLTLKAGVNLCAFECDEGGVTGLSATPHVTIVGNATATFAGVCVITGVSLQTNSAEVITISGTAVTIVNCINCFINATNNSAFVLSSSGVGAILYLESCWGNLGTTGINYFACTNGCSIDMRYCQMLNGAASVTANTINASVGSISFSVFLAPISTSNASALGVTYSRVAASNTTALTLNGTGTNNIYHSIIESGTASAVTIGTGAASGFYNNTVGSSNTNAITGVGTIIYSNITYSSTSSVMNTTTQTPTYMNLGKYKASGQPAFLAYQAADQTNATGAGTVYTLGTTTDLTEVFDQNSNFDPTSGVFTAPETGQYLLGMQGRLEVLTVAMLAMDCRIVSSNRVFLGGEINPGVAKTNGDEICFLISALADMDVGDTATFTVTVLAGAGNTATVSGSAGAMVTYVYGKLEC